MYPIINIMHLFDPTQRKTRIKFPQGVNKKAMQKNPALSRREQPRSYTPYTLLVSRSEYPRDKPFQLTMVSYLKKKNQN